MKLIIDIPDTIGKHIRESYNIHLSDATLMKVKKAIKSGTPLDDLIAEIDRQEKWLAQAGYTPYNTDIAFDAIKSVLKGADL
jgi:hypothetical protein